MVRLAIKECQGDRGRAVESDRLADPGVPLQAFVGG
jgi:hypothetical protein